MTKDALGDRMKRYEALETDQRLMPFLPVYARIDGRGFSRFTRGMDRPFDVRMHDAMCQTAKYLMQHTHAAVAYTQSDEISLLWYLTAHDSSPLFDGKVSKLTSVLAGMATAGFTRAIRGWTPYEDRYPAFDARVCNLPNRSEATNMVLWRVQDAEKNAVSMAARAHFSAKEIHGLNRMQMLYKLAQERGVQFHEDYPPGFRRGTFVKRRKTEANRSIYSFENLTFRELPWDVREEFILPTTV